MMYAARRCGHPGEIPNGFKNGTMFLYPNRVTYSCVEGYELIGRPYRVCQADGQWSGTLPECKGRSRVSKNGLKYGIQSISQAHD